MLASLLRRLIFIQAAAGAIMGFLLHRLAGTTPWSPLVGALLLPLLTTLFFSVASGLLSRSQGPVGPWLRSICCGNGLGTVGTLIPHTSKQSRRSRE